MPILLRLIFEFFKTGLFAVGGGLATIPFLQEMGVNYGWFDTSTLTTMIAISESTPGPMGINMATYVGYNSLGILGGVVTSLSLVVPSIIIVCIIASKYEQFKQSKTVQAIFAVLRAAVAGFIASACMGIFMATLLNIGDYELSNNLFNLFNFVSIGSVITLLIINHYHKLNPIYAIVGCAIFGIIFGL